MEVILPLKQMKAVFRHQKVKKKKRKKKINLLTIKDKILIFLMMSTVLWEALTEMTTMTKKMAWNHQ
jgi:hypothetical protein